MSQPQLLAISGSLRSQSFNTAILSTLIEALASDVDMALASLADIPLYNADLDGDSPPPGVVALKSAIADCDGLVISSPEYNYGMPGVLKNALDWISRPAFKSPLKHKPVLIMTASPAPTGGARAHAQLRETLAAALAEVMARPQLIVPAVHQKIEQGRLADQETLDRLAGGVGDLCEAVKQAASA